MSENANEANPPIEVKPTVRVKNPELLARMVIREGKDFKSSALACGYSISTADKGLKRLLDDSSAVAAAVERETTALMSLTKLKPFAVQRLFAEITNPKSAGGLKAIEIAGRFKETDWFVKNTDVQIGIFQGFADGQPDIPLDAYKTDESEL